MLTAFTGDAFFPSGFGEFIAPADEFLVFEDGPSVDVTLQWATYFDAADECSLSRIYGGIHPRADDIPGRLAGDQIGQDAFEQVRLLHAASYEQIEGAIEIRRAKIFTKTPGSGRIDIRGTLFTGISSPDDALNIFTGLRVNVSDGLMVDESYEFSPDKCNARANGGIVCLSEDRATKVTFKPERDGGERAFKIAMKKRTLPATVAGPIELLLRDAVAERTGTAATCVNKVTKVICRE